MDTTIYMRNARHDAMVHKMLMEKDADEIAYTPYQANDYYDYDVAKVCPHCGGNFYRRINTSKAAFETKIFCNNACKSAYNTGKKRKKFIDR